MKLFIIVFMGCFLVYVAAEGHSFLQQNTAKTDLPGKGPCTNFPSRYQKLTERLAWFYGCMHENPPSIEQIRARIVALPPERRIALSKADFSALDDANQEALIGVAFGDLPMEIFPKK